jgi:hypothetical protein
MDDQESGLRPFSREQGAGVDRTAQAMGKKEDGCATRPALGHMHVHRNLPIMDRIGPQAVA